MRPDVETLEVKSLLIELEINITINNSTILHKVDISQLLNNSPPNTNSTVDKNFEIY